VLYSATQPDESFESDIRSKLRIASEDRLIFIAVNTSTLIRDLLVDSRDLFLKQLCCNRIPKTFLVKAISSDLVYSW
jgi:hypothetical protein